MNSLGVSFGRISTASTKKQYEGVLRAMLNRMYGEDGWFGKDIYELFKDKKKVEKDLKSSKYINTRHSKLSAILKMYVDKREYRDIYEYYKGLFDVVMNERESVDANEMTEKQKENWLSKDEVVKIRQELFNQFVDLPDNKVKGNKVNYYKVLKWLLISLYTLIQTRRSKDYASMVVVRERPSKLDDKKNYFITSEKKFIFNVFKTNKTFGRQEIEVPIDLMKVLLMYSRYWTDENINKYNSGGEVPLLMSVDGDGLTGPQNITKLLNSAFGKKVSSSMLRHIFITYEEPELLKYGKNATKMGHSINQAVKYYKNVEK